jgi:FlaA1/EpsC-like NDP-sugar epimerase
VQKIFRKFYWVVLDLLFINFALIFSLILAFGKDWSTYFYVYRELFFYLSISFLLFALIFKFYKRVWRYLSIGDLFLIAEVVTGGLLVSVLYLTGIKGMVFLPTIIALTWFFSLALIGGSRLTWRIYGERDGVSKKGEDRILIVGAGDAGVAISRQIIRNPSLGKIVGFADNDQEKIGKKIHNIKVLWSANEINGILEKEQINKVIIAIPTASGQEIRRIIDQIKNKKVKIRTLPGLNELINGEASVSRIRQVSIEDLLGRKSVKLNLEKISHYLKGKKVLVTGGGGSIGKELGRQICRFAPQKLTLLDHSEYGLFQVNLELKEKWPDLEIELMVADIRDREKMDKIFKRFKPEVVFHAAAYKHVPMMEYHPDEAISSNIIGTKNVGELANQYGVERMVMISTDKAINPTSVMGASKRVAEMVVKDLGNRHIGVKPSTKFVAVRFGNVLESNGNVVHMFKRQIAEGGPVTVTDKRMMRYFMTLPEASQLVLQAGALGKGGEVFILDMGEPVKIFDVARDLIFLSGLVPDEDIEIKIIGLRPGEKLFEELLTKKEKKKGLLDNGHEKIFIAQVEEVDGGNLEKAIQELEGLAKKMDMEGIVKKLQEVVPNYQPNREMME